MNHKGLKGGGERFPQKPESSIISSGADAVISLSHYVEGCVESKHCTNPRDTTAKQKLLGSNKLTDCLLASIHLFVGKKNKKKKLVPCNPLYVSAGGAAKREGFASVHVLVVAHVGVVGLHLALDHGLLPPAAGHHQADEESLQV